MKNNIEVDGVMKMDINIFFLYKIEEKNYLYKCDNSLAKGNVYFSCCGKWMCDGKTGKNAGQGDKYEGVFAKYLKCNSEKAVKKYKELFGDDLIKDEEGKYLLFYRKSSLLIPACCFYSCDNETGINNLNGSDRKRINSTIKKKKNNREIIINRFPLSPPQKYLYDFKIDDDSIGAMTIQPLNFLNKLRSEGVFFNKIAYIHKDKEFDIFEDKLYKKYFSIKEEKKAIDEHIEIFFKDKHKYSHQCELRCAILNEKEKFTTYKQSKIISLTDLKAFNIRESIDKKANGYDLIYDTKNFVMYGRAHLEKKI